jgi:YesN/AraC family two-component response regulator
MGYVLAVDDDPEIRDQLVEILQGKHFVQEAENGEKALEWLEKESEWHVVITDISMPGLSGLELLGHIKQKLPDTPVIVLSGLNDAAYKIGAMEMNVFKYLTKPYRLEEIEASVDSAVAYHKQLIASRRRQSSSKTADRPRIYALSITITNVKSGESKHEAEMVVAASIEEAKQKGFEQARQKWSLEEGWMEHSVVAKEADREFLLQAAPVITQEEYNEALSLPVAV